MTTDDNCAGHPGHPRPTPAPAAPDVQAQARELLASPLVLDAGDPADLLGYLPYRLGYEPADSLAVLAVCRDADGVPELGLVARLDLAELCDPGLAPRAARAVATHLQLEEAVCVWTVLYTGAGGTFGEVARRYEDMLSRWYHLVPRTGPETTVLVSAATDRFRCLLCLDQPCCPAQGHPMTRARHSPIAAAMVLAGHPLAPDRASLACPRNASTTQRREAGRAAASERQRARAGGPEPQRRRRRERALDRFEHALARAAATGGPPLPAATLGRLVGSLEDPDVRDAVVALALTGYRYPVGDPGVLHAFEEVLAGSCRPPSESHRAAVDAVLSHAARVQPRGRAGHPLAVLAWSCWWNGYGVRADVLVRQSLQEDPSGGLAQLLGRALAGGLRPGWAQRLPKRAGS